MENNLKELSEYEKFVMQSDNVSFMQSECWSELKKGWKSERIIIRDEFGNVEGAMQILIKKYLFSIPVLCMHRGDRYAIFIIHMYLVS